MPETINGGRKMIVKSAVQEYVDNSDSDIRPGTDAYSDLMMNVEGQVQTVLEECGELEM